MRQVYKNFIKTICVKLLFELYPGKIMPFSLENTSFSPSTSTKSQKNWPSHGLHSPRQPRLTLLSSPTLVGQPHGPSSACRVFSLASHCCRALPALFKATSIQSSGISLKATSSGRFSLVPPHSVTRACSTSPPQ